jgi:hypothetical protein
VICVTRLSPEQRYLVTAAARLAEARAASLTVVGSGIDGLWVEEFLGQCDGLASHRLVQDGDVAPWIRRGGVRVCCTSG